MTRFHSILVATDFSEAADNAVRRAALIAAEHEANITLLKVVDPAQIGILQGGSAKSVLIDHQAARAHTVLGRYAVEMTGRHDVHVRTEVRVGDALRHTCAMAEDADLLVIGASSGRPWKDVFFPTAAERLSRLVRRPLLVVKPPVQGRYRRVLVPVDFTARADMAMRTAMALAPSARMHLFHALGSHPSARLRADVPQAVVREYEDRERHRGVRRLAAMAASLGHAGINVSVDQGHPARLIVERQKTLVADLVVMGKTTRSTVADLLLGSVAHRALSQATSDVLVIPAGSVSRPAVQAGTSPDAGSRRIAGRRHHGLAGGADLPLLASSHSRSTR